MSKKKKIYQKEDKKTTIKYPAWTKEALEEYPITTKHIGAPISLAESPNTKRFELLEIHTPGTKMYPEGGYKIKDNDYPNGRSIYFEEARGFPPKKIKANSQLALKTKKKKKPKKKKKKSSK